jgi:hypothetical protein
MKARKPHSHPAHRNVADQDKSDVPPLLERSFLCGEIELYMYEDRVRRVDQWLEHAIARAREE